MCDQAAAGGAWGGKKMKVRSDLLMLVTVLLLDGCSLEEDFETEKLAQEEVKVPVIFRVEPATNESSHQNFVNDYNEAMEGSYELEVEWLMETAAGYRNKLKQWNVMDELPALITDAGFDTDLYRVLVANNRLVNLRPYMEESDFWMEVMNPDILADCTEEDGSIYLAPLSTSIQSYAGIIYNEELLKEAGYETVPETWDEFFACLEDLKAKGITPLGLHGSGSYWVPMLLATSYLVRTEEGQEFLKQDFPESYQNEQIKDMLEMLKRLYDYTWDDALEIDYDQASKRFTNGEAAIFANGYWMLYELREEEEINFRFTCFPEGVLMNSPRMSAWAIPRGYSEEIVKGAVRALEFRIQCELEDVELLLESSQQNPVLKSYADSVQKVQTIMPNYQMKWEQEIQNEFFTEYMPLYLNDSWTMKEFLHMLDNQASVIRSRK